MFVIKNTTQMLPLKAYYEPEVNKLTATFWLTLNEY